MVVVFIFGIIFVIVVFILIVCVLLVLILKLLKEVIIVGIGLFLVFIGL